MSPFYSEAFLTGTKNGAVLAAALLLVLSFFRKSGLVYLRAPLLAGAGIVLCASFGVAAIPVTMDVREVVVKLTGFVFGLFYLFSLGALFHSTGTDLLGPFKTLFTRKAFLVPFVFLLAVLYCVPDMAGATLYVSDLYSLAGRKPVVFALSAAGFGLVLSSAFLLRGKFKFDLMRLFDLPQILLSLALIKLLGGGVRGFAELSLVPAAQAGLMKLVHDAVHQSFLFLLVPDHQILTTTTWNFIGVLFGNTAGLWLSLIIIALPLVFFMKSHFSRPVELPVPVSTRARRRLFMKAVRDERVLKSLPVFLFLAVILASWFTQTGEATIAYIVPDPKPVSEENGLVVIPLQRPGDDVLDGNLHKYVLKVGQQDVRLLMMKKPDGTLAVCLDACEICPPDGYGQAREHVVCTACKTPIPFDTLGQPGGCNPIPLNALVTEKDVRIDVREIIGQWARVKSGQDKESIAR